MQEGEAGLISAYEILRPSGRRTITRRRNRDRMLQQCSGKGAKQANLFTSGGSQLLEQKLCRHFLQVEFYSFNFAPTPSPSDEGKVLCFGVQECRPAAAENAGCSSAIRLSERNPQPRHDAVPLLAISMQ